MRSDSVASFLDLARESNLLAPNQFDDLFAQPDVPQSNLAALCDFLVARKVLTAYQAGMIRAGRGYELSFAGYPVYDDLGPCPGGTAYRVAHPSLRTPLILRRLRADWLAPADNVAAFVQRAQAACPLSHPNLAHLLDAGVHRDEPFVVLEPFDGGDLDALIADIGPMPTALAVEYIRQAARGLATAHARGLTHGDLRPKHLAVGPLVQSSKLRPDGTPRLRPASIATVRLAEFGLVPRRPAGWAGEPTTYLSPERAGDGTPTPAGDVFALGGCLHYLLTGRPPGSSSLANLRPDTPPAVAELVRRMTDPNAAARPTAAHVLDALDALSAPAPPSVPQPAPLPTLAVEPIDTGETRAEAELDPLDVEVESVSDVALIADPLSEADPLAAPSGVGFTAPAPSAPGGWGAYSPPPVAPTPFVPALAESPAPWQPTPFVPTGFDEEDGGRSAPGYDPVADGASMRRKPRQPDPDAKRKLWLWLGVGIGLWLLAILLWVLLFTGGSSEPEQDVKPRPVKPKVTPKKV